MSTPNHSTPSWHGLAAMMGFLIIVYTLTNSGGFHIIDEVSRFAVTESLALRGEVDTNAIAWTQWVNSPREAQGDFGPNGDVFSKKGPAQPILSVIWYLLLLIPARLIPDSWGIAVGQLQWTMLFTSLVTAATAGLLWRTVVRLGYPERVGAASALLFGLATIAWPYATYLLAEPLSGLCLLGCFYSLLVWRDELADEGVSSGSKWLWLAGVAGGLAVATTIVHILLMGIFGLFWLCIASQQLARGSTTAQEKLKTLIAWSIPFLVPLTITAILMVGYNLLRFGIFWNTGYQIFDGEFFITPLGEGVWGLLLSPYRSFFLHTPLFIASLLAFPNFYRRHRLEALTILGVSAVIVLLYGKWWMWWGGYAWGPRFLVPLAPFWVLLLAPLLHRWVPLWFGGGADQGQQTSGWRALVERGAKVGFGLLVLLSIAVQFSAVVVNFVNFETELRGIFPTDWLEPLKYGPPATALKDLLYSPVLGQWQLLFSDPIVNSDLAWLRSTGEVLWIVLGVGGLGLFCAGALFVDWWRRMEQTPTRLRMSLMGGLPLLLALVVMLVWIGAVSSDPRYGVAEEGYRAILERIDEESGPDDAVITVAPYHYTTPMNWFHSDLPVYGYSADSLQYAEAQTLLTSVVVTHPRLWFVTAGLPPADANNSLERWLADMAYKADDQWYGDFRLVRYATGAESGLSPRNGSLEGDAHLIDIRLTDAENSVTLLQAHTATNAAAGQTIPLRLTFWLEAAGQQNLRWFAQLLNGAGEAVAMSDSASQGGYRSFVDLPVGEEFVEQIGLHLPATVPAGQYQLIVGLYNPERDGARLVDETGADHVRVTEIVVGF